MENKINDIGYIELIRTYQIKQRRIASEINSLKKAESTLNMHYDIIISNILLKSKSGLPVLDLLKTWKELDNEIDTIHTKIKSLNEESVRLKEEFEKKKKEMFNDAIFVAYNKLDCGLQIPMEQDQPIPEKKVRLDDIEKRLYSIEDSIRDMIACVKNTIDSSNEQSIITSIDTISSTPSKKKIKRIINKKLMELEEKIIRKMNYHLNDMDLQNHSMIQQIIKNHILEYHPDEDGCECGDPCCGCEDDCTGCNHDE